MELEPGMKLYCVLAGRNLIHGPTGRHVKDWSLNLYGTERGRKQGMARMVRETPTDCLTFELTFEELFARGELAIVMATSDKRRTAEIPARRG